MDDVRSQVLGMEHGCDVLPVDLVGRVEVVGSSTILEVKIGDKNTVACGGGIVSNKDAEGGLARAVLDRGEVDRFHGISQWIGVDVIYN